MILDPDKANIAFHSYGSVKNKLKINRKIYEKVFEGDLDCETLEDVFSIFNLDFPDGYAGRSMSVSDVVEVVKGSDSVESAFYYCNPAGFTRIYDFNNEDFDLVDSTEEVLEEKEPDPVPRKKSVNEVPFLGKMEKCNCPVCGKELPCMGSIPKKIKNKDFAVSSFFCPKCEIQISIEHAV